MKNFIKTHKLLSLIVLVSFIGAIFIVGVFIWQDITIKKINKEANSFLDNFGNTEKNIKETEEKCLADRDSIECSCKQRWERWNRDLNDFNTVISYVNFEAKKKIQRTYQNFDERGWEKVYNRWDYDEELYEMEEKKIFSIVDNDERVDIFSGDVLETTGGWGYTIKIFKDDKLIDSYKTEDLTR